MKKQLIIGILFILNLIGSVIDAIGIYLNRSWAWALGAFIAGLSIISYILSRTVGLPATHVEEWETLGIVSLFVEGAYLLVYALTAKSQNSNN